MTSKGAAIVIVTSVVKIKEYFMVKLDLERMREASYERVSSRLEFS